MDIKKESFFKNEKEDRAWFENWVSRLEALNGRQYQSLQLSTSLGKTHVWSYGVHSDKQKTLVIFPGARTTSLFWDFDKGLDHLGKDLNIFLVETNGLPNLSDGKTPDIKGMGYGYWAKEVLDQLKIQKAFIAGASFGGLVAMKLGIVAPERTIAVFLLNPGCLQSFSLKLKNLYYNLLPLIKPNRENVKKFLDKAVFCAPHHQLSAEAEKLIIDYELFAITRYQDNTQKPYYMGAQLEQVKVATYLLEGDQDLLFPYQRSINNAKEKLSNLKDVQVFKNVGHGIEICADALKYVGEIIKRY